MSYHTLLAHLPDEEGAEAVLDVAATIADAGTTHLIGLHVLPSLELPYAYYSAEIPLAALPEFEARRRGVAKRLEERFEQATRGEDIVAEWRLIEALETSGVPSEQALIEQANTADLVIAAQPLDAARRGSRNTPAARLLAGCGRAVLMVPPERTSAPVGERVFIAWDGERAATRALFAALPLLKRAGAVRLQRVNTPSRDRHRALGATEALAEALARHGVSIEVFHADARASEVGEELLAFAADWGADTIVSGALERGGMREFLLGSTTRHLLEHTRLPLLMSS